MVTVLRADGVRVIIYRNDHLPAHVHVVAGGEAKIDLGAPEGVPRLIWVRGMTQAEVRRCMRVVTENRAYLLAKWDEYHGRAQ